MKKIMVILVFLMLLGNNIKAHGGGDALLLLLGGVAGSAASIPLAATPYLFKNNDTNYDYFDTLTYAVVSSFAFPVMTLAITKNRDLWIGSYFIAPILGTMLGFDLSKRSKSRNSIYSSKNHGRLGWYGGIGLGASKTKNILESSSKSGVAIPMEFGYGVTEDLLIYLSFQWSNRVKNGTYVTNLNGIGVSYYLSKNKYIKTTLGTASLIARPLYKERDDILGQGFSIGYGNAISKRLAIELTYTQLYFDNLIFSNDNKESSSSTLSTSLNYRWF